MLRYWRTLDVPKDQKVSLVLVTNRPESPKLMSLLWAMKAQTHEDFEVLVVHDGPLGMTHWPPIGWDEDDERFFFLMNYEATGHWGYVIRSSYEQRCAGKWIGGLCDDDWVAPVYLENLLHAALTQSAQMAYCDYLHNYTFWARIHVSGPVIGNIGIGGWIARDYVVKCTPYQGVTETADGERVERMIAKGIKAVRVDRSLFVHG